MNPTSDTRKYGRYMGVLLVVLLCLLGYRIYSTERSINASGILSVSTPAPGTTLTITQAEHTAKYFGTGAARIRLQAGSYLVGASISGEHTTKAVTITKAKTTTVNLSPSAQTRNSVAPTPTGFINFDSLVNGGLSADQETTLEHEFVDYRPTAQVFGVDPQSISVIVPDPSSGTTTFTMNFSVTIDTVPYQATIQYTGYDFVQLKLLDSAGNMVYQGYPPVKET